MSSRTWGVGSLVMIIASGVAGCGGGGYQYAGYSMDDFFPFDGARTWEYVNTDVAVPYKLIATLDNAFEDVDGKKVHTVDYSYECLDPKGKDCPDAGFVRAVRWSSNASSGVLLHSFEDISGRTNYDPPIALTSSRMVVGDSVETQTGGVTYTSTFDVIVSECPIQWVDTWTGCPKITLDDGGAEAPLAGEYYAIGGYNVVAMELTGDTGQWQLLYATYADL